MTIRYAWLITPLAPFALAFLARFYWIVMGHQWVSDRSLDTVFFFVGLIVGAFVNVALLAGETDLGGFKVCLRGKSDD